MCYNSPPLFSFFPFFLTFFRFHFVPCPLSTLPSSVRRQRPPTPNGVSPFLTLVRPILAFDPPHSFGWNIPDRIRSSPPNLTLSGSGSLSSHFLGLYGVRECGKRETREDRSHHHSTFYVLRSSHIFLSFFFQSVSYVEQVNNGVVLWSFSFRLI